MRFKSLVVLALITVLPVEAVAGCNRTIYNRSSAPWQVVIKRSAGATVFDKDGQPCVPASLPDKENLRELGKERTRCALLPPGASVTILYRSSKGLAIDGSLTFVDQYGYTTGPTLRNQNDPPSGWPFINFTGCPHISHDGVGNTGSVVMNRYPRSNKPTDGDATIYKSTWGNVLSPM